MTVDEWLTRSNGSARRSCGRRQGNDVRLLPQCSRTVLDDIVPRTPEEPGVAQLPKKVRKP